MTDQNRPWIDVGEGRIIEDGELSTVGRLLVDEPIEAPANRVDGHPLREAAEIMLRSPDDWRPIIVRVHPNGDESEEASLTLAFVNDEAPDDVVLVAPLVRRGSA